MAFSVAPQLWDNLLTVLSSLTQWKEVVVQWKVWSLVIGIGVLPVYRKIMEFIYVYIHSC